MLFNQCNWFRTHSIANKMKKMCLAIKDIKHKLSYFVILCICLKVIESSQYLGVPKQKNSAWLAPKGIEKVSLGKHDTDVTLFR